jgi:acyl-CoA reductase-like NAD-dependent aldehyde dehydrogenase
VSEPTRGVMVAGQWRDGDGRTPLEVRNPARPSEVVASLVEASREDVADACAAAAEAAAGWRRTSALERGEVLYRAAELISARADELGADLTREEGKTLAEGRAEALRSVALLRYFAGETAQPVGEVYPSGVADRHLYTERVPLGVVGLITPWNFPLAIPVWKLAPALAFGNAVVWKPSQLTPCSAVNVVEILHEAGLPPGVLNLVNGGRDPVGEALVDAPQIAAISFTGSTPVGRAIQAKVAPRGVKVQLELGGKNPVIVMDDADVDLAVRETVRGSMMSTGQKCTATSRAIVVGDPARFTDPLLEAVSALRVGDPMQAGIDVGPLASAGQLETVLSYFDVARDEGHELAIGGTPLDVDGGYFVAPTVYTGVGADSRIAQEEVFGPVLGVISAGSIDEAVRIANDVDYGLSAAIFTRDVGRAFEFAREVEAGVIHVNSETAGSEPQVPFGGMKDSSSHSREQGKAAREFYTDVKTVYVDMPASERGAR